MALSLRAASGGNQAATSATSQAITLPTGTAANDIVYFVVSIGIGTVSGASTTVGSGWTLTTTTDATGATSTIVGYKTVGASETAPTVSWTNAGRVAWSAIAIAPGAGNNAAHSLFATPSNTGTAATTKTPPATTAVAGNTSVILTGARTSANANGTLLITTPPTNWTEPTNGDQGTSSGNARQQAAEISYRLGLSSGAVTPSAESFFIGATATSSFAIVHHALIAEGTAYAQTITDAAGATDSNTPVLTPTPLIETLTSDFASGMPSDFTGSVGSPTVTGGQLVVPTTPAYDRVYTPQTYSAAGSSSYVQVVTAGGNSGTTCQNVLLWYFSAANQAGIGVYGGAMYGRFQSGGVNGDVFLTTYNPTTHAWWRIRESGGTFFWDTSPDGTTWNNLGSQAHTFTLAPVNLELNSGYYGGSEPAAVSSVYDNLNTLPAISTLTDDFATQDTTKWTWSGSSAATAGQLVLPCTNTYLNVVVSARSYNLTGSSFYVQVAGTPTVGNGTTQMYAQLQTSSAIGSNSWVGWGINGATLSAQYNIGGSQTAAFSVAYSSTTHKWLRIRESGGTTFWDTSPDASTWTNRASVANPITLTSLYAQLGTGYYGTETSPGNAIFDNVNTAPAGGTAYSQTVTDAAGAVDATSSALAAAQTITDAAGATDAASPALAAAQTVTDAAGAADTLGPVSSYSRTTTDAAGAVDTTTSALAAAQTVTDAAGAVDTTSSALAAAQTVADAAGAADTVAAVLSLTLTDAAGAVDTATSALAAAQTVTDAAGAADSAATTASYAPTLTDAAGATDTTTSALTVAVALTDAAGATDTATSALAAAQTITDVAGAADTAGQATTSSRTVTDTADATDSASPTLAAAQTVTDTADATDSATSALAAAQTVTDTADATDSATSALAAAPTLTDAAGAVDATTTTANYAPTVTDPASAADVVQVSGTGQTQIVDSAGAVDTLTQASASTRTLTDSAGAADTVAASIARTLTDSAGAADTVAASTALTLTDAAGAMDTLTQSSVSARTVSDAADAVDTVTASSVVVRTVTDTADAADAVSQSAASDVAQTVTDVAGALDTVAAVRDLSVVVTDVVGAVDTADRAVAAQRVLADAAEIVDSAAPVFVVALSLLDAVDVADTTTPRMGQLEWAYVAGTGYGPGLTATRSTSGLRATRPRASGIRATRPKEVSLTARPKKPTAPPSSGGFGSGAFGTSTFGS